MNQYRRIVSYLYKYNNGKKGENTGFIRVETREEGIRLHLHIKDLRMMDQRKLKVYFYIHRDQGIQLIFVDEFLCVRGNCEYKNQVSPDLTSVDFDDINGVVFLDREGLVYGSCWDEREIDERLLLNPDEREDNEIQSENLKEQENERLFAIAPGERGKNEILLAEQSEESTEKTVLDFPASMDLHTSEVIDSVTEPVRAMQPVQTKEPVRAIEPVQAPEPVRAMEPVQAPETVQAMNVNQIMSPVQVPEPVLAHSTFFTQFPPITLNSSDNLIQAARIQLDDISRLSHRDWKLADNAFLKQAYEMENHLMVGKIRMQNEKVVWILGVPGRYDNREKYLAGVFGFNDYIPQEQTEFKTGGRGYWIRQISPVE